MKQPCVMLQMRFSGCCRLQITAQERRRARLPDSKSNLGQTVPQTTTIHGTFLFVNDRTACHSTHYWLSLKSGEGKEEGFYCLDKWLGSSGYKAAKKLNPL
ncbi:UNVERIFIED_CONTAM: hypothetical protein K2H54_055351 [Gekko kuhli]